MLNVVKLSVVMLIAIGHKTNVKTNQTHMRGNIALLLLKV